MSRKPKFQLIILGHAMSRDTLRFLNSIGPYKPFKILFHIERFDDPFAAVYTVFKHLHAMGCDLSGRTPTIWQTSGSTIGAHVLHTAWHRMTGQHMRILNVIRRGDSVYAPSPELPIIDLGCFYQAFPEALAAIISTSQEALEAEAVDDDTECKGVIDMTARANEFRKLRAIEFGQSAIAETVAEQALHAKRQANLDHLAFLQEASA